MHTDQLDKYTHSHDFGLNERSTGERRTLIVVIITAVFMIVEISAGIVFGSIALLADGLHMGSHALALGISVAAYVYARRHAKDERFAFGTGKVNALGGFTGALLLAGFALLMAGESLERIFTPVTIDFNKALLVAVLGLLVNGASVALLGVHDHHDGEGHHHDHSHHHHHGHAHEQKEHDHSHEHHDHHHEDHNLRAAYLHVLADALTSLTAIIALLAGKYFGLNWLDPVMGIVGSLLVGHWSWGLLKSTSQVLLDHQVSKSIRERVQHSLESNGDDRVTDLHIWSIGPGVTAACLSIVSHDPQSPDEYKQRVLETIPNSHITIEIHQCQGESSPSSPNH